MTQGQHKCHTDPADHTHIAGPALVTEHCTHAGNCTERYTHTYIAQGSWHTHHLYCYVARNTALIQETTQTATLTPVDAKWATLVSGHNTDRWSSHKSQVGTALRNVHCIHAGNSHISQVRLTWALWIHSTMTFVQVSAGVQGLESSSQGAEASLSNWSKCPKWSICPNQGHPGVDVLCQKMGVWRKGNMWE
jgi:hypothetical protein